MMEQDFNERIKQLEHTLQNQQSKRLPSSKRKIVTFIGLFVLLVAAISLATYTWMHKQAAGAQTRLPISQQSGFNVYYFNGAMPGGFKLDTQSVSSNNGLLLFRLQNKETGKEIVVTQQFTGEYDYSQLQGDKEFRTPSGQAFITDGQSRTTGALFTDDKTWILLNAASPIGAEAMSEIINGLSKYSY